MEYKQLEIHVGPGRRDCQVPGSGLWHQTPGADLRVISGSAAPTLHPPAKERPVLA